MSQRIGLRHVGRISKVFKPAAFTVDLAVDALVDEVTEFQRIGSPEPLLDLDDDDTGYIHATYNKTDKYYTFEDLGFTPLTLTEVLLRMRIQYWVYSYELARFYLWHDSAWDYIHYLSGVNALWKYVEVDVTSELDSVADINAARVYFNTYMSAAKSFLDVTYACLRVTGTRML